MNIKMLSDINFTQSNMGFIKKKVLLQQKSSVLIILHITLSDKSLNFLWLFFYVIHSASFIVHGVILLQSE